MKKIFLSLLFSAAIFTIASAQKTEVKANDKKLKVETAHSEKKVKKTTTPKQKIHNVLHPKNKEYSGTKVKHEGKKED